MRPKHEDCYIDVWRDANFEGEVIRIYGPAEYPNLHFTQGDWGDEIGSLRVGPQAFVLAYRDSNFKDEMVTFGPNDSIPNLRELKFNDDIDSVQVIDSLKIFDRVNYNAERRKFQDAVNLEEKKKHRRGKRH